MTPYRLRAHRQLYLAAAVTVLSLLSSGTTAAHGPDPLLPGSGTLWHPDQVVPYQWQSSATPPAWMATAIDLGAGDVGESRSSRAAIFVRATSAKAVIAYGGWNPCDSYGIACMDRTGMTNGIFGVWFRPHGWVFDWGSLRWCQGQSTPTNGCYDAENTALDELGHVEILGHHVNYADGSDFTDAVVQYAGHARPKAGYDAHAFGRCDIARLQLEYERRNPANPVSTCLSLSSSLTLGANPTSLYVGDTATFTATLKISVGTAAEAMSGDPLSDRTVSLQRRAIGSTTWTTVATMGPSAAEGAYAVNWSPTVTYDWRATFTAPSTEGLNSSTSTIVRVTVTGCSGTGCPRSVSRDGGA
jgi:hypothetical protein